MALLPTPGSVPLRHSITVPVEVTTRRARTRVAPAAPPVTYELVAGDCLSAIADAQRIDLDDLLAANELTRWSILYPGERIVLP